MNYFKPEEFDCKCGRKECDATPMRPIFIEKLNAFREAWGAPMTLDSARRCKWHNENMEPKGAPKSEHLRGNAVDIATHSWSQTDQLAKLAEEHGFGGIGRGATFIHIDLGAPGRRWTYPYHVA